MNMVTILLWITIAIIAAIAIIVVKLHYRGEQLETEEGSILPSTESINNALNFGNEKSKNTSSNPPSLSPHIPRQENNRNLFRNNTETKKENDAYIVPEVDNDNLKNYEYHSENQVLINYNNNVNKFQEPIKESQMDIMTQNNKDTSELKDLFTIDELIKESKRKDSEREKESQTINKPKEDAELDEIKQSIKNKKQEPLIEEVISESAEPSIKDVIEENKEEEKISDIINETPKTTESETPSVESPKEADEEITTSPKEEVESTPKEENISDVLSKQETPEKISEPALKSPSKIVEEKDKEILSTISNINSSKENEEETMDLDYRKDLDKFANKIKGSKIFQEVKEKLSPENEEIPQRDDMPQEDYIRNVNEYDEFNEFTPKAPVYDEYEPIINETHVDYDASYEEYHDQRLRQENTKRVFDMVKNSPEPVSAQQKVAEIKNKPARDNIKINLNNNEVVLKKGDEIIFNHAGETYSSQVYAINGDDISVKYRRKNIKIKPSDVKKIY